MGFALLINAIPAFGQTYNYATATPTSSNVAFLNSSVSNPSQASGASMTDAAVISSALLDNDNYVQIGWTTPLTTGTPVYIKLSAETTLLNGLLGGAVGNLVTDLAQLLVDGQEIRITAYNGSTAGNSVTLDGNFNNEGTSAAKIIQDRTGQMYVRFTPSAGFDGIRIRNRRLGVTGLLGSRTVTVYGAYTTSGTSACTMGNFTNYTGNALVSADLSFGDPAMKEGYKAIDVSGTTFSKLSIGTAGALAYAQQNIYFVGTTTSTDKYNIKMSLASNLIDLGLLERISIIGYSGNTPVYTAAANTLISAEVLGILQSNNPASFTVSPGVAIDRIAIRVGALVSVTTLNQAVNIYSVTKGDFSVAVTGGATVDVGAPVTLTAIPSGCSTYTYSWSNGLGSASTATPSTTTPGATTYTVTVTDAYGISKTGTATVIVRPVGGTITGGGAICYNETPGNLTLSGYNGTILRWEKSTDAAFTSPTTIANTTTTLAGSVLGPLTSTLYVRAVVGATGAPNAYATTALTVTSTTWNGSAWSNGTPDITTRVFITGLYTQAANLSACTIEVSNNAVVDIPAGYTVTINGYLHVNTGSSFTLEHNAHLVQITDATNLGSITQKRDSNDLFRLDYTLWSSPLVGLPNQQTLRQFSMGTSNNRFYIYNYDTADGGATYNEAYWPVDPLTTYFEKAKAFLIRMPNSDAATGYGTGNASIVFHGSFTGVPTNGPVSRALSIVGNKYTAIGNPYPSPINVQAFFDANESIMEPGTGLYFWRKKNDYLASSYATLNRVAYASNQAVGAPVAGEEAYGGSIWDNYFAQTLASQWVINTGQGFLIRTKLSLPSAEVTFSNSMRRGIHTNQFFKNAQTDSQMSRYWLDIKGTTASSVIAMVYMAEGTTGIDAGLDAQGITSGAPLTLYSIAENMNLAIQTRPEFEVNDVVTLGYKAEEAGQHTISIHRKDGVFEGQTIYLRDKYEGLVRNLTENDYTFSTEAGVFNDRFEVIYTTAALDTATPVATQNSVVVYKNNSTIAVNAGSSVINSIQVLDIRGRVMFTASDINDADYNINSLASQNQVLLVQVNTSNGTITKKIIY
jgi:hypothetical protein